VLVKSLSYRDVEELLAERGLDLSYETIRRWVLNWCRGNAVRRPADAMVEGLERKGGDGSRSHMPALLVALREKNASNGILR